MNTNWNNGGKSVAAALLSVLVVMTLAGCKSGRSGSAAGSSSGGQDSSAQKSPIDEAADQAAEALAPDATLSETIAGGSAAGSAPSGVLEVRHVQDQPGKPGLVWTFTAKGSSEARVLKSTQDDGTQVEQIKASPDGKALAVVLRLEGSQMLQVLDLAALIGSGEFTPLSEVDPFPGGIEIAQWKGPHLLVRSDMLLDHAGPGGRVPAFLQFRQCQDFEIDVPSGKVQALSGDARSPMDYFLGCVSSDDAPEAQNALLALEHLGTKQALDQLRHRLADETDAQQRGAIQQAIEQLERQAASAPATMQSDIQPAYKDSGAE